MEFPLPLSSLNKFENCQFILVKIDLFFVVQYAYGKFKYHDCTPGNDLDSMAVGRAPEAIYCRSVCNKNPNCGGFAVYASTCYFKSHACRSDLKGVHYSTTIYLKQGIYLSHLKKLRSICCFRFYFSFLAIIGKQM